MAKHFFKIFYNFCIVFISLFVATLFIYLSLNHVMLGDDLDYGVYTMGDNPINGIMENVGYVHGGGFFSILLTRFFVFTLPIFLNLQPADFMGWGSAFFQSFFFIGLMFSFINFFPYIKKIKPFYLAFFLFNCSYVFFMIEKSGASFLYVNNNNFWRYPFSFLFFNIFLLFLFSTAINKNKKVSLGEYLLVLFSTVVSAVNNDFLMYEGVAIFALMVLYDIVTKLFFKSKKYLHINLTFKNFYALVLLYAIAMRQYIISDGYQFLHGYRTGLVDFIEIKSVFWDFVVHYVQVIFINYWYYWVIFAFVVFKCFKYASKNKKYPQIILPLFPLIASLAVMFSLIVCVQNGMPDTYWIISGTIQLSYIVSCYICLLMLCDYFYKHWKTKKKIKIYLVSVILVLLSFYCFRNVSLPHDDDKDYKVKVVNYIADKMLRFYYLKNETPILFRYENAKRRGHGNIYNYEYIKGNIDKISSFKKGDMICTNEHPYILNYYAKSYGEDREKLKKLGVCYSYDAFERFYKLGGTFSEDELKNVYFGKLKNDKYIFEKQENPIDVKENFIVDIMD